MSEAPDKIYAYVDDGEVTAFLNPKFINAFIEYTRSPVWISVDDRLPEDGLLVFVETEGSLYTAMWFRDGAFGLGGIAYPSANVTHWMRIPEVKK